MANDFRVVFRALRRVLGTKWFGSLPSPPLSLRDSDAEVGENHLAFLNTESVEGL